MDATVWNEMIDPSPGEIIDQTGLAEHQLLVQAKEQVVSLISPGELLSGLTRQVLEAALEAVLTEIDRVQIEVRGIWAFVQDGDRA